MNYKEFCRWLDENNIYMKFGNCSGYANDTMQFSKDGKWFLNARYNCNTNFDEVKKRILDELNN